MKHDDKKNRNNNTIYEYKAYTMWKNLPMLTYNTLYVVTNLLNGIVDCIMGKSLGPKCIK